MTFRMIILPFANEEMEQLYEWMKLNSEAGAKKWREALFKQLDTIHANPFQFQLAPENSFIKSYEIRHCVFGTSKRRSYRIIYTVKEDILILNVRSPDQDLVRELRIN